MRYTIALLFIPSFAFAQNAGSAFIQSYAQGVMQGYPVMPQQFQTQQLVNENLYLQNQRIREERAIQVQQEQAQSWQRSIAPMYQAPAPQIPQRNTSCVTSRVGNSLITNCR